MVFMITKIKHDRELLGDDSYGPAALLFLKKVYCICTW